LRDWVIVAIIIAIPFVIFGALEVLGIWRYRKSEAIARRPKGRDVKSRRS
jgi:hypothetical protein